MSSEAKLAFYSAIHFHEAAIRCGQFEGETAQVVLEPRAACFALAIELYFKSLHIRRVGPIRKWHELAKLFKEKLDKDEQRAIAAHYEKLRQAPESRMLEELEGISDAFVKWRYSHEAESLYVDQAVMSAFAKSAYLTIREIAPEWDVEAYYHDRITAKERFVFFAAVVGKDPAETDRAIRSSIARVLNPKTGISEGQNDGFSASALVPYFYGQTASFKLEIGRSSNSEDGGPGEAGE
jgi:hypothetical protein